VGGWGAGWVGRKAAGAGENFFERLSVAGVRGMGVSGLWRVKGFLIQLPGKSGSARSVERKLGKDCGERGWLPIHRSRFSEG